MKEINHCKKNNCCNYIPFAIPPGRAGMSPTITIGTVTTGNPGSEAEVINSGTPIDYTTVGRATGTNQIVGLFLIETTTANSVLTVRNPARNPAALTITPLVSGASSVTAHLLILQIT